MALRRSLLIVLAVVVGLAILALVLRKTGLVPLRRRPPEAIDRGRLRAEMAAKRERGEDIAVKTIQDLEWEKQEPGVEFVVRGDALSGVVDLQVDTPSGPRQIGKLGGLDRHHLHITPEPGTYSYRVVMGGGARQVVVPVERNQLTRVVITLKHTGTERKSLRTIVSTYDADVVVEAPHPAGTKR